MSRPCPLCTEAAGGSECPGFLFESAEYRELLHCNNCGAYFARNRSPSNWPPYVHVRRGQLSQYERYDAR